jgi:hypothetical protein
VAASQGFAGRQQQQQQQKWWLLGAQAALLQGLAGQAAGELLI